MSPALAGGFFTTSISISSVFEPPSTSISVFKSRIHHLLPEQHNNPLSEVLFALLLSSNPFSTRQSNSPRKLMLFPSSTCSCGFHVKPILLVLALGFHSGLHLPPRPAYALYPTTLHFSPAHLCQSLWSQNFAALFLLPGTFLTPTQPLLGPWASFPWLPVLLQS